MRALVALGVSLSLATTACFPDNEKARTIAKISEGGLFFGGIGILAAVNTSADCSHDASGTGPMASCQDRATTLSDLGLGMMLLGLIGFIVTVSTSPDDNAAPVTMFGGPATPAPTPTPSSPTPAPTPAR